MLLLLASSFLFVGVNIVNSNMRGNLTQTGLRLVNSAVSVVDCSFSLFFEVGVECTRTTHSSEPTLDMTRCTFSGCGKGLAVQNTNVVLKDGVFMNNNRAVHIVQVVKDNKPNFQNRAGINHSKIDVYGARTRFSHNRIVFTLVREGWNGWNCEAAPSQLRFHLPEHHTYNPTVFASENKPHAQHIGWLQISTVPLTDKEQRRYELSMQKKHDSNTLVNHSIQADQPDQDVQKWFQFKQEI
jgi:hypothetical protein